MTHDPFLQALSALADAAQVETRASTLLTGLVDIATEHLAVDGAGIMVAESSGLRLAYASPDGFDALERIQETAGEGPCHDALTFDEPVVVDDLSDPVQTAWPEFVAGVLAAGYGSVLALPLTGGGRTWGTLDLYRRDPGTWRPAELAGAQVLAHLAVAYLTVADDRDEARRVQRELAHAGTHDALTGLPNRVLLFDRLEQALNAARRDAGLVAVFFIDLDRFKSVNDTFGHAAGDLVLTLLASRMSATLRRGDTLARLSGDEFVLVSADLAGDDPDARRAHVDTVTERLRHALARPVRIAEVDLVVSATIGVTFGGAGSDPDDLLADADRAMYRLKHAEPGARDHPGEPPERTGSHPVVRSARQLERELVRATAEEQLEVHYQPLVHRGGRRYAVEALLRWPHPHLGLLVATEFVDLAARSGLLVGIGQWVVRRVGTDLARWREQRPDSAPAVVYVNVSSREILDPALPEVVAETLRENGLRSDQLGLELLEGSFADPEVVTRLHEYVDRGHPLSIDDFGTGYSSLSRLVDLPVRLAKIDKSFVAGIEGDPRRRALVDAVVTVAEHLGLQVVAEGVETAAQASAVRDAGCHYLQGWWCGAPAPLTRLLDEARPSGSSGDAELPTPPA
ncbi:putative bifunctional diguanylate cyclase/phosphodiesterase [Kineococcus gynurae]|uniref:Bifunctional diguanylate cyclase/phosphodiesterase n=1 Tax=Kineococcus gynurae TaxID=452979 RepID=A0ABV5LPF1_9ACTN